MKTKKRFISLLLCLAVFMSFTVVTAFADDGSDLAAKKVPAVASEEKAPISDFDGATANFNDPAKAAFLKDRFDKKTYVLDDDNGDFIDWNRADDFVLYKGQKLYMDYTMYDTWENYYTIPYWVIYDEDMEEVKYWAPAGSYWTVTVDDWDRYVDYFSIDSNNLPAGEYSLFISAMPCDQDGWWTDDFTTFDIPTEVVFFTVKKLPKPTYVKLTAGKKRVTISFKKSTGATKYEIYRSLKKSSGYKKIATITGNKYVDKTAKKGKRYYYKVRALRGTTESGKAYSFYTTPKRSAKVK